MKVGLTPTAVPIAEVIPFIREIYCSNAFHSVL